MDEIKTYQIAKEEKEWLAYKSNTYSDPLESISQHFQEKMPALVACFVMQMAREDGRRYEDYASAYYTMGLCSDERNENSIRLATALMDANKDALQKLAPWFVPSGHQRLFSIDGHIKAYEKAGVRDEDAVVGLTAVMFCANAHKTVQQNFMKVCKHYLLQKNILESTELINQYCLPMI